MVIQERQANGGIPHGLFDKCIGGLVIVKAHVDHRVQEKVTIPQFTILTIFLRPIGQDHSSPEQVGFFEVLIVSVMRSGTLGINHDTGQRWIRSSSQSKVVRIGRLLDHGGLTVYHQWRNSSQQTMCDYDATSSSRRQQQTRQRWIR